MLANLLKNVKWGQAQPLVKFGFLLFLSVFPAGAAQETIPLYRIIPGASAAVAGPGDSLYVLSTPARIPPTAGSWISSCPSGFAYYGNPEVTLARVSSDLKMVYWSTCVPFGSNDNQLLGVDPRTQSVLIAGTPVRSFVSDAGARLGSGVPNQTAVVRIKSDGSASDLALLFPSEILSFGSNQLGTPAGFEVLPNGTFVMAFGITNVELPVTSNAVSGRGPGYLIQFSADGKQILYATYLGGSVTAMAQGPGGKIWLAGQIARNGAAWGAVQARLPLPFASETMLDAEIFVSQFEPASGAFLSFARIGLNTLNAGPKIAVGKTGRAVLVLRGGTRFQESALVGFEVNELGTGLTVSQRVAASTQPQTLGFDAEGNWVVVDRYIFSPPPVTAGSTRFPNSYGESSFLRLSGTGKGVLSATVIQEQSANSAVTGADGTIYITASYPSSTPLHPAMRHPEPVSIPRPTGSFALYAYPKTVEVCGGSIPPLWILWDVRDVPTATTIELHAGTATGPLLATGSTGVLTVPAGNNSYVLVQNPNGGPFALPQTLATETTSLTIHPLRCSYAAQPTGEVIVRPNPVLGCASPVNTGNIATVSGSLDDRSLLRALPFIRVGKPAGTVFTSNLGGEMTEDWVRNGMEFFLAMDSTPDQVIASQRAYVLPIRDCQNKTPPPPAISATRDCVKQTTFTLAFSTGEPDPVAIRENAPDGPAIALQDVLFVGGVLDVTTTVPKRYYLTMLMNGVWQPLASVVADPGQACEQGALP